MKIVTSMAVLREPDVKPELLAELLALLPECRHRSYPGDKDSFKLELPENDPRIQPVLDLLHTNGYPGGRGR